MKQKMTTHMLVLCALFAALTAILSQVVVPIGPVPINLATFSVLLAGGVLGARAGGLSQLAYVLLGAMGAPVFSLFRGGIGMLVGPTGGYIAGYIVAAVVVGLLSDRFGKRLRVLIPAMLAGTIACYTFGTAWFMLSTGTGFAESFALCVLPFLPGDAIKVALAAVLTPRVCALLRRNAVSA